jgi:hypothetical protein
MLTKIVDPRELKQGVDSLLCVDDAIGYRVNCLTGMSAALRLAARRAEVGHLPQTTFLSRNWTFSSNSRNLHLGL